jgi:hypothetical protein
MLFARKTGVLMLAAVASGATFNSAFAQQEAGAAETRGITEIVVTARKREEKINEVPWRYRHSVPMT